MLPLVQKAVASFKSWSDRHGWIVLSIVMLIIWYGGYMLVGELASPRALTAMENGKRLEILIDQMAPFLPQFILIYITVYPAFLLPFFLVKDRALLPTITYAYLTVMLISYTIFLWDNDDFNVAVLGVCFNNINCFWI